MLILDLIGTLLARLLCLRGDCADKNVARVTPISLPNPRYPTRPKDIHLENRQDKNSPLFILVYSRGDPREPWARFPSGVL